MSWQPYTLWWSWCSNRFTKWDVTVKLNINIPKDATNAIFDFVSGSLRPIPNLNKLKVQLNLWDYPERRKFITFANPHDFDDIAEQILRPFSTIRVKQVDFVDKQGYPIRAALSLSGFASSMQMEVLRDAWTQNIPRRNGKDYFPARSHYMATISALFWSGWITLRGRWGISNKDLSVPWPTIEWTIFTWRFTSRAFQLWEWLLRGTYFGVLWTRQISSSKPSLLLCAYPSAKWVRWLCWISESVRWVKWLRYYNTAKLILNLNLVINFESFDVLRMSFLLKTSSNYRFSLMYVYANEIIILSLNRERLSWYKSWYEFRKSITITFVVKTLHYVYPCPSLSLSSSLSAHQPCTTFSHAPLNSTTLYIHEDFWAIASK